jgi:transketolase
MREIDRLCVDTIRFLAVDAVEKAKSGHPGMPMGAAPMAYVLWDRFLRHDPAAPRWFDRDRFVLSAGHGSMLLYALLHLYGYDLPLDEIARFRQWGSRTPGHPEHGLTPGVEATTGPLGQGVAVGVGMAIAEAHLAARFNDASLAPLVDHTTYAIVSDGDLMEGVASEAASLAGHLALGKLVCLYDDNRITIEGKTDLAFTEDVGARFAAYGWHVQTVDDGNDLDAIESAIRAAREETARPSLVKVRTHIGYGSPKQDSEKAHGEPLGPDAARAAKEKLGWPLEPAFHVPDAVYAHCRRALERGGAAHAEWRERLGRYRERHPERVATFERLAAGELPREWDADVPAFDVRGGAVATRAASGKVLGAIAGRVDTLIGGSADLAPSNKSEIAGGGDFGAGDRAGRNLHFGVREHAMAAVVNGMALHGGVRPYGATFLVFSDYMRPSLRLAALMRIPSLFIFTHDSLGVGEDGPTHQPVEHLLALRAIPGLTVLRPADANETAAAWRAALTREGPSAFALTRQNVPVLDDADGRIARGVPRGAYVLAGAEAVAQVTLVATGSEVHLVLAARGRLAAQGVAARVVSMPSWEIFSEQPEAYREEVLPRGVPRVAVEAGRTLGWREIVGDGGAVLGVDRFGESAPGAVVMEKLGLSVDAVVTAALRVARAASSTPEAPRRAAG